MLPLSVCIYSRLCSNPLPQPLPPFPLVFRVGYRPANGLPRIYIGRLCAPDYRASSQLFARVTTKLPAATLSIDASRFQKLMKLGPPSSFQVGSPSFPAKSRPLAILPIFFLSFFLDANANECLFTLPFSPFFLSFPFSSFPRVKKSSVESRMERFGVIARGNWGKNSRGSDRALLVPLPCIDPCSLAGLG